MVFQSNYPDNYLLYNTQQTKTPAVVVDIPGLDLLGNCPIFKRVRYGDPGIVYGLPGLVYGGLLRIDGVRDYLSLDGSSLTVSQKIEPEQGRSAVGLLSLAFIDKNLYMSQAISPGVLIEDIIGSPVTVRLGFQDCAYPEDYFIIFRGYVTGTLSGPGIVTLQLSDPNVKRRQKVFKIAKTKTTSSISNTALVIPLLSGTDFFDKILGPGGIYDPNVKTFIKIEDEYCEYGPGAVSGNNITVLSRGQRGTIAVTHDADVDVQSCIEIDGNAIDIALKVMLSGFAGPYKSDVAIRALKTIPSVGDVSNVIVTPIAVDAVEDLGLAIGDYFTITGSVAGNNKSGRVTAFGEWSGLSNRLIYTDQTFNSEPEPCVAVMSLRSQFDTLPVLAGLGIVSTDVDIAGHISVRDDFLSNDLYSFFIQEETTGKTWLENEIYLVEGCYSVSRFGKLSVNITRPPTVTQSGFTTLDHNNVIDPQNIVVSRATNTRRFFNEILYSYDLDDSGNYTNVLRLLDADALARIGISSVLPINSGGLKSSLSGNLIAGRRGNFLLSRYKFAAYEFSVKCNWQAGSTIESGDVILLKDEGNLQITNIADGTRNLGSQLLEVIDRKLDIKSGNVTLQLLSGVGFDITDRYSTISPSSLVAAGSTSSNVIITESFGNSADEQKKWLDYVGLPVRVHNANYTVMEETTLSSFDVIDDHMMILDPPLSFTPSAGYIVDIADYPTSTDPKYLEIYKQIHAFVDHTGQVVTGISQSSFSVTPGEIGLYLPGLPVFLHSFYWAGPYSNECIIDHTLGNTVYLKSDLGFVPVAGNQIELIGFADGKGPYRII